MSNKSKVMSSKIRAVTVFYDRAHVIRTANQQLEPGEHNLVFDDLPAGIEEKSIQVNGTENAVLKDVTLTQTFFAEIPEIDLKNRHDALQKLQDEKRSIMDTIGQANKEKQFVESIGNRLTAVPEKNNDVPLDPEQWIKMVDFYRSKCSALDTEIHEAEKSLRTIDNRMAKLDQEIRRLQGRNSKRRNQVEVIIEVKQKGETGLDLSYIVYGPSWQPVYDIRVSSDDKKMNIAYNALIQQNTSEAWENVELKLSTAQAHISGQQPELQPWYIDLFEDMALAGGPARSSALKKLGDEPMTQMMPVAAAEFDEAGYDQPLGVEDAHVDTKATSVVFHVPGKNTIMHDNEQHKTTILMYDFPVSLRYSTVPKLAPYAYLKAKVKNTTDFPFLAGSTNVFLDNNFVANAVMQLVAPGEEFWTYLGIDEGMKVEHKFIKQFLNKDGIFNRQNRYTYEYLIEIINNKKTEEEIVIWDQLPVSQNEKIKVTLVSPEYKEDSDGLKKNEFHYLEWLYKPGPGEKISIPFKFIIEYPQDKSIAGL